MTGIGGRRFVRSGRWLIGGTLATLLAITSSGLDAASPRWTDLVATVFHNYGRDQGLPHPVPTALAQDRDGFIWIGTQGGLTRWDGYRFHAYKADPDVPGSLPDDWVQTLHVDAAGRLWVGGGAAGLARYDAEHDRFESVSLGPSGGRTHIAAIADDGRGGLWVGSDEGLHHVDPGADEERVTVTMVATGPPNLPVRAVLRDRKGGLWVGTIKGLVHRPAGGRWTPVALDADATGVSALYEDDEGRIWIGTIRHGLFVVDRGETRPHAVGGDPTLSNGSVSTISAAGTHDIWVGMRGAGIVAVDRFTRRLRSIRHDRTVANSLVHNDIWAILQDNAGSLWVGTTGGLSYHPRSSGLIATLLASQGRPGGLNGTDPQALLATRDGHVWVGYLDGGVDVVDPVVGRIAALRPGGGGGGGEAKTLPPDIVFAMAQVNDGGVYIGTRRGLYYAPPSARNVRRVDLPGRDPGAPITALSFDRGLLWVGSDEGGLIALEPGPDGRPRRIAFATTRKTTMTDQGVNVMVADKDSGLWVGTRNGLFRIDRASHAIEHITADANNPRALPGRYVVAMLTDRNGRLWVGTFGGGVAMATGRDKNGRLLFRRLGLADGLPHLNVDSLQMDGAGTIWAGTDDGLARIDPATFSVRPVRQADGSALIDYYAGAGATSRTGEALFGAKGGITIVRPGPLPRWTLQPPLVVTDLRIGGVSHPVAQVNGGSAISPITIHPGANSLAVEFAALDYTAPERNRYSYRLDGFDPGWSETDANRRLAIYTNLPPGDYVLRLRGSNRAGVWTEHELALPVKVLPAWYQRWWAKAAAALALALAVLGLIRWRTRYLRRRQVDLERQIADRTADLRAANEQLGHLAMTDPLTGCFTRRHFMMVADERIATARIEGRPLCLAILDLDDFKGINDRHGHPGGDAVLEMTGIVILDHLAPGHSAGRIGGEEFALLMPDTDIEQACILVDQLREAIGGARVTVAGRSIGVTASAGVAERGRTEEYSRLYARADAALYTAKDAGRNRVEAVDPAE